MNTPPYGEAQSDLKLYARAMISGDHSKAAGIEEKWDLYGYPPEVVSTVLSCVATGLSLDQAIYEATQESA